MKKLSKYLAFVSLLTFAVLIAQPVLADNPPPPPPSGTGNAGNKGPGGAPIDGGLGILLALGAGYGAKKLYHFRKEKKEM